MISESELYCPETSNVSVTKLAGLLHLRQRLDQTISEFDNFVAAAENSAPHGNLMLARHSFESLPVETRRALRDVYALSAENRITFGDTKNAAREFQISFAFGTPSIEKLERYLQASIDAEIDGQNFSAILQAYGDVPHLRFVIDCYRIRQAIRNSQMPQCKEIVDGLTEIIGTSLLEAGENYSRRRRDAALPALLHGLQESAGKQDLMEALAKARSLLRDCDRIVDQWQTLLAHAISPDRSLRFIEKLADGRTIVIASMQGRGWVFSHMVEQIETLTRSLDHDGIINPFIVILNPDRFVNTALMKMYRRKIVLVDERHPRLRKALYALHEHLKSIGSPIARSVDPLNSLPHIRNTWARPTTIDLWAKGKSVVRFEADDEARGRQLLRDMGVPDGAPFACFAVREDKYYQNAWTNKAARIFPWSCALPGDGLTPTNSATRDNLKQQFSQILSVLNVDIKNYALALKQCAERGIYMIRLGIDVEQDLPLASDPHIIDYARNFRTEFGDVYLMTHCKFTFSGATGNYLLSYGFQRPLVVADNYICSAGFHSTRAAPDNMNIPRLYWYVPEKRFLTFGEMFHCARYYQHTANCAADQVEVIPNTPEDIADVVDEMNRRIDGTWMETPEDTELQRRVQALFQPYHEGYGANGRIGAAFLRKYESLIR